MAKQHNPNLHDCPEASLTMIDYTGSGSPDPARAAANLLVFTKQTRLQMHPGLMQDIREWPLDKILDELEYMANTIPSSWEFINYTFLLNNVTRAFTHQLVRTRTASFAQQTMRVLDVSGWTYGKGPTVSRTIGQRHSYVESKYEDAMANVAFAYEDLIDAGAKIEDARGILPTNIHTNIVVSFNLRTLAETTRKRASKRTQGEYRDVMDLLKAEVIRIHPWADLFLNRTFDVAAVELEALIGEHAPDPDTRTRMTKLLDQLRTNS